MAAANPRKGYRHGFVVETVRYFHRNPNLFLGSVLMAALVGFLLFGVIVVDVSLAAPLSAPPARPPSTEYLFGTDSQGRNMLAVLIVGTLLTAKVGLVAGAIGIAIGSVLAFVAAYYGGWVDAVINWIVDVLLTVPGLLVLVVLASAIQSTITTNTMALVIALLAWREPTRQIRSQVLVMRERPYVAMARLSGMSGPKIIFQEMMPNLLPYLMACFVTATSTSILSSIALEALGLGSPREPTLGMTIYWLMNESAFMRGMWWWIVGPIIILVILFVSLYLISAGLDELANPRLRRKAGKR